MAKTIKRKICIALSLALALMSVFTFSSFAATHDTIEDVSTNTATLRLGKILNYTGRQNNTEITSVQYKVEKVQAWANDHTANSTNGQTIAVANMPAPNTTTGVTVSSGVATATIPVSGSGGTSTGTRDVTITFNRAGYYVYKITENAISTPTANGGTVVSDTHVYYALIYVCNDTDSSGNTTGQPSNQNVYVHDIASWRDVAGSDWSTTTRKPANLSDIANGQDNGGTAAQTNNQSNLGKVGHSSSSDPDLLEAYKMWNTLTYPVNGLTITKNVTGSLGDLTKNFQYTVSVSGLEPSTAYTITNTGGTPSMTTGTISGNNMTTSSSGALAFTITLKDGQSFNLANVPQGATWSVTEAANNHKASVVVTPAASAASGKATVTNSADNTACATNGTLTANTTVAYTNERNIATVTGVGSNVLALSVAAGMLIIVLAAFAIRRKNNEDEEYLNKCEREGR